MKINKQKISFYIILIIIIVAGGFYYWNVNSGGLPAGFAQSNGRIEATEIDIATKTAGRIETINVKEGDFVKEGQELARMDTRALQEQLHEVQAQLRQAISAVTTAESALAQRKSEKVAAQAVVRQREAELDAAQKRLNRSRALVRTNAVSQQQVDDDTAQMQGARAALEASKAQVAAATSAIDSASAGIVQAKNRVDAATATERRIIADLDDSILKAPRNGRIQYRVAEPGEVLGAGGRVLNMVDLSDVYMTFFLPTEDAGKVALGSDVHIILDAAPNIVIPAKTTFVASVAQFTPKTVETQNERLKLMFRVRARISPDFIKGVTNLRGVIIPIIDLRVKFSHENVVYNDNTVVIVVNLKDRVVGIVVDGVSDVLVLNEEQIAPPPDFAVTLSTQYLTGLGTLNDRMLILVDIEKLLTSDEMALIDSMAE